LIAIAIGTLLELKETRHFDQLGKGLQWIVFDSFSGDGRLADVRFVPTPIAFVDHTQPVKKERSPCERPLLRLL